MAEIEVTASTDVFPPDFSTAVGRIRALIPDVEQVDYSGEGTPEYMFSDAHLGSLYAMSMGSDPARLYRATAAALRALATSEGLIQKVIRTEDLQTDGAKLANALLANAKQWDDRAEAAEEEEGAMAIVDFQPLPQDGFSYSLHGFPSEWTAGLSRPFREWL